MPASPICQVREGFGPWSSTTDGFDVTPSSIVGIRLADPSDVSEWYLRIFGTDEEISVPPTLMDVNPLTSRVTTPLTVVTLTAPATTGHALLFESTVVTTSQTIRTTFGIYLRTSTGLRVGAVGETREGSSDFGWATTLNKGLRAATGGGFTAGGDLSGSSTNQTVARIRGVNSPDPDDFDNYKFVRCNLVARMTEPMDVAYDGTHLWVINSDGRLYQIDPSTRAIVWSGQPVSEAHSLAVDADRVYITTNYDKHVALFDKATYTVAGWAYVNDTASFLALDGAGNFCVTTGTVSIQKFAIAGCLGMPRSTKTYDAILVLSGATGAVTFGGGHYWVMTHGALYRIYKIDSTAFTVVASNTYTKGTQAATFAFGYLWVATGYDGSVLKIDPTTLAELNEVTIGGSLATNICAGPDNSGNPDVWLWTCGHFTIYAINPSTGYVGSINATSADDYLEGITSVGGHVWAAARYATPWYTCGLRDFDPTVSAQVGSVTDYLTELRYDTISGDVSIDSLGRTTILNLQGRYVYDVPPNVGDVFTWNGFGWIASPPGGGGGGGVSGDLSGTVPGSITVVGWRNRPVDTTAPAIGQVYKWSGTAWSPANLFSGLTTNAIAMVASSSGAPGSLVGTASGQVATWNGSAWTAAAPSSSGGTMSVVLGSSASQDDPVYLDESRDSSNPGLRAYKLYSSTTFNLTLESGSSWPGPTQPYAYDICAIKSDLYLVAYRMVVGSTVYLRLRAISLNYNTGVLTMGSPVDIQQDVGSNEVAYVSCCMVTNYNHYTYAGAVAWANPTTGMGYVVGVLLSGTTITTTAVQTFSSTAVLGTAITGMEYSQTYAGAFCICWGDVSTNKGQSIWYDLYFQSGYTPVLTVHGSKVAFTNMAAADIGQPTLRSFGPEKKYLWIAYGLNERRVNAGLFGGTPDLIWYLNPANYPASTTIVETRVDGYGEGGAGLYILNAPQHGTGDFLAPGESVFLVSGTRTGYTDTLYLVYTKNGEKEVPNGAITHTVKVVGGISPSWGTNVRATTIRAMGPDTFLVGYYCGNANNAMYFDQGRISPHGDISLNMSPLETTSYPYYISSCGTSPQHYMLPFRITDYFHGILSSQTDSNTLTNSLKLTLYTNIPDPRNGFVGFLQSSGSRGDTRTITIDGGLHTFNSTKYWRPGQPVYLSMTYGGTSLTSERGHCLVGIATGVANQILVRRPARAY
jgi:hypothetical protein